MSKYGRQATRYMSTLSDGQALSVVSRITWRRQHLRNGHYEVLAGTHGYMAKQYIAIISD